MIRTASPPEAERVAFYRGKCLACHSAPAFAETHFPATPDCTSCHMPRSGAIDTPHVAVDRPPHSAPGGDAAAECTGCRGRH